MLVAYRLAGLSALETHYAAMNGCAQRGPRRNELCGRAGGQKLSGKPDGSFKNPLYSGATSPRARRRWGNLGPIRAASMAETEAEPRVQLSSAL